MIFDGTSLEDLKNIIDSCEMVFIAAAGCYGEQLGEYFNFSGQEWAGYLDNNVNKQKRKIQGKSVYSYEKINEYNKSKKVVIIATIMKSVEIENTLKSKGVEDSEIIRFKNRGIFDRAANFINRKFVNIEKAFKDIEVKDRCFIIGTGPSLTIKDLEMLRNEVTFSVNSIIKCFGKTDWRPTYYLAQDPACLEIDIKPYGLDRLARDCQGLFFSLKSGVEKELKDQDNIYFYSSLDSDNTVSPPFSDNIRELVYESGTVIYSAIQIAFGLGFKKVYMLGVDLGFSNVRTADGKIEKRNDKQSTASFLLDDLNQNPIYEEERIISSYKSAKLYADKNNIIFENATRGGYLEVLNRANLDDLMLNHK